MIWRCMYVRMCVCVCKYQLAFVYFILFYFDSVNNFILYLCNSVELKTTFYNEQYLKREIRSVNRIRNSVYKYAVGNTEIDRNRIGY